MIRSRTRFAIGLPMALAVAACSVASLDAQPTAETAGTTASAVVASNADFNPHSDRKGIGLLPTSDPTNALITAPGFDPRRSLAVTDQFILGQFTFKAVLDQIVATSGVSGLTSAALFQEWWDTQNVAPGLARGPHCNDEFTAGVSSLNGFPYNCPRAEGQEVSSDPFSAGLSGYMPIGLFNRFDLAPTSGADCGEYRIVFARHSGQASATTRNLVIFEGILPNPSPASGIQGCLPVAQFWRDLSSDAFIGARATKLKSFYFNGLPGFEPVVHANHYGAGPTGGGQIRSNQFMQGNWMLREYKTEKSCTGANCTFRVNPSTTKVNPFGGLFTADPVDAGALFGHLVTASEFQSELVSQVPRLADSDINRFDFAPSARFNSGQSQEQGPENDYSSFFARAPASFRNGIQSSLNAVGSTLTPAQIVARAEALSCAGCHQLSNGADLGAGMQWPSSLGFTHVSEQNPEDTMDGGRFRISPALTTTFLPFRQSVLLAYLRDHEPTPPTQTCRKLTKNCCGDLVCLEEANVCPFVCHSRDPSE